MCGVTGFSTFREDYLLRDAQVRTLCDQMRDTIAHRGPDSQGTWVGSHAALGHVRLAVMDPTRGLQPMRKVIGEHEYIISYNGEIYNADELRLDLFRRGYSFETTCDTEVLLLSYIAFGEDCLNHLNGIFAFAIWDELEQKLFMARDRFGVKPLFYAVRDEELIFGSEIKALLAHPHVKSEVDKQGLSEILSVGPGRTCGYGVFKDVHELCPAQAMRFTRDGLSLYTYWHLESRRHTEDIDDTVNHTRHLLSSAIERQLQSDVPLCTFLSGGLDSSVLTAYAAKHAASQGHQLETYSFDYVDNDRYFHSTAFQPDSDAPFAKMVSEYCNTNHDVLLCHNHDLPAMLENAMQARDLPGMADIDASLMMFCSQVRNRHVVALSGECADEVFGGYPWFHRREFFEADTFPWNTDPDARRHTLARDVVGALHLDDYVHARYEALKDATPVLECENPHETRRRQISYMNLYGFMQTLLERKDRMSMSCALEVRVPFCDHELVDYVFNVPWEMKYAGGETKGLLRAACADLLPPEALHRRKSPYPKTHHPLYEQLIHQQMLGVLANKNEPIHQLIHDQQVRSLCEGTADVGKPWFGQLMAGPQLIAWLLQLNAWLKNYKVRLV